MIIYITVAVPVAGVPFAVLHKCPRIAAGKGLVRLFQKNDRAAAPEVKKDS